MNGIENNKALDALGLSTLQTQRKTELGQEDFLSLMLTQLKNQDPFKPMESGEFLGQIAQFGAVAGIGDLKTAFSEFSKSIYSNQALQASTLVGRTVLTPGGMGYLQNGGTIDGVVELPESSPKVVVSIYDGSGQLVRSLPLGTQAAGEVKFQWDGKDANGTAAAPGAYLIGVEAQFDGKMQAVDTLVEARVQSVSLGGDRSGLTVNLEGLGSLDFSSVRQIM